MKKLILITGALVAFLNFLSFLIFSSYGIYSFFISEICIIISTFLIYYTSISNVDDAFKIFSVFFFSSLAVVKFVIALFFKLPFIDNYVFLSILIIVVIEILIFFALKYFSKHA